MDINTFSNRKYIGSFMVDFRHEILRMVKLKHLVKFSYGYSLL